MDAEGGVNHLHSVAEGVINKSWTIAEYVTDHEERSIVDLFKNELHKAVCFDAGDAAELCELKAIPDLVRLPFDVCWIEFKAVTSLIAVMCIRHTESDIVAIPFFRKQNGEWLIHGSMKMTRFSHDVQLFVPQDSMEWHKMVGRVLNRFLSAMNCSNVERIESKPPAALSKARARRGKQPLFSTWTLSINIPKERRDSVALGGSHASPRVHLRRGHPREYKPGSWTWVQPCAVGAKENGMIHKDYKAVVAKP